MTELDHIITLLNHMPASLVAIFELLICLGILAALLYRYSVTGLYCYIAILLIAGNIQVLKGSQFIFPPHPIAMGTMLFGIIALTFDIITEYYGKPAALKGVQLGFILLAFFTVLMFLTVGYKPLDPKTLNPDEISLYENHLHIKALFIPLPGILIASLTAYLTSQYSDVVIFSAVRRITHERLLWLRTILSTSISAFIDTALFSVLAWKVLSPVPVTWSTLFTVYIFGTYPLRLLCSVSFSPLIYLARYCLPRYYYNEYLSKI